MPPVGASLDRPRGDPAMLGAQLPDGGLEILERLEGLVHAREPEVGDFVELAQRWEDSEADVVRLDLRGARCADGLLDLLRD